MAAAFGSLQQLMQGYQVTQILYVVAKFRFADILKDGPKSGEEVAQIAKTHPINTNRVLRAAAGLDIISRDPVSLKYGLTDVSRLILDSGPGSMRHMVLHLGEDYCVRGWSKLDSAVESGAFAFKEANGVDYWENLKLHPDSADNFNNAMTAISTNMPLAQPLTEVYGLKEAKQVVDVGGGQGMLLTSILRLNPHLHGSSFDLPNVIEDAKAKKLVDYSDLVTRFEYASGSFFESVPAGGDIYFLKAIIHDWEDSKAIDILKTIKKSLPDHGKVVLLETILKETGYLHGTLMDLHMMVLGNAKERTEEEFSQLFAAAGLKLSRVVPLPPSFFYAIEAVKQ
jgi:hypothetical protein